MKTRPTPHIILVAMLLCHIALTSTAQQYVPDRQWLAQNGRGKSGWTSIDGQAVDIFNNFLPAGNDLILRNVYHPYRSIDAREKNDVFIIYDDGHVFLSRSEPGDPLTPANDPFYPWSDPARLTDTIHRFQVDYPSPVRYFYLTNRYEGDDPPDKVRLSAMQTLNPPTYTYALGKTLIHGLTAHQDITPGADIILIMETSLVDTGYRITANRIRSVEGRDFTSSSYFTASPSLTGYRPQYSNANLHTNSDGTFTIEEVPNAPYIFLSLRATNTIPTYSNTPDGKQYKAIFTLEKQVNEQWTRIASDEKLILMSHDPNYIKFHGTCQPDRGKSYAFYRIAFQNDGTAAADSITIRMCLPKALDGNCIGNITWSLKGLAETGSYQFKRTSKSKSCPTEKSLHTANPTGGEAIFTFTPTSSLKPYSALDPRGSVGYIEFCMRVNRQRFSRLDQNFVPTDPIVKFGRIAEPILDFYGPPQGPIDNKGERPSRPAEMTACNCSCNPSSPD